LITNTFDKFAYLKALRGARLQASHFRVLVELWNRSDAKGERAFPGLAMLASDCVLSVSTVTRALNALQELGWIHQDLRGGRSGNGRAWASVYSLTIPDSAGHPCAIEDAQPPFTSALSVAHPCTFSSSPGTAQHVAGEPPSDPLTNPGSDPLTNPGSDPLTNPAAPSAVSPSPQSESLGDDVKSCQHEGCPERAYPPGRWCVTHMMTPSTELVTARPDWSPLPDCSTIGPSWQ
jgi:Helix-turn-helix domain